MGYLSFQKGLARAMHSRCLGIYLAAHWVGTLHTSAFICTLGTSAGVQGWGCGLKLSFRLQSLIHHSGPVISFCSLIILHIFFFLMNR